jgi:hypothetical protein
MEASTHGCPLHIVAPASVNNLQDLIKMMEEESGSGTSAKPDHKTFDGGFSDPVDLVCGMSNALHCHGLPKYVLHANVTCDVTHHVPIMPTGCRLDCISMGTTNHIRVQPLHWQHPAARIIKPCTTRSSATPTGHISGTSSGADG